MTTPAVSVNRIRPDPVLTRRSTASSPPVVLRPLVGLEGRELAEPAGYLARAGGDVVGPEPEIEWLAWTLKALEVLAPSAFLAAHLATETIISPLLGDRLDRESRRRLLPIIEPARVGGRVTTQVKAMQRARDLGLRMAAAGHRLRSGRGFDAVFVTRRTQAATIELGWCRLLVATELSSAEDLTWAGRIGAGLVEGSAVSDPIRVAPVDVRGLGR